MNYNIDALTHNQKIREIQRGINTEHYVFDDCAVIRRALVLNGYHIEELSKDKSSLVRSAVVYKGYDPVAFMDDESPKVRAAVVRKGCNVPYFIDDEAIEVQLALIEVGYQPALAKYINSNSTYIRRSVAEQCYGLDVLATDPDDWVRISVIRQGYNLEEFAANDPSMIVRFAARHQLDKQSKL
ncbi:hypothetical protein VCHA53O466_40249 [Vibrio chagasii]|nr:hypothetical protein VCHA53O466_40249 [Vibrio chagasii]